MSESAHIQRIELCGYRGVVHCPICGWPVLPAEDDEAPQLTPCGHTPFIATDAGFGHRSERFARLMGITGVDADDLDTGGRSCDGLARSMGLRPVCGATMGRS